jgi:hypothetical protein
LRSSIGSRLISSPVHLETADLGFLAGAGEQLGKARHTARIKIPSTPHQQMRRWPSMIIPSRAQGAGRRRRPTFFLAAEAGPVNRRVKRCSKHKQWVAIKKQHIEPQAKKA